MTNNNRWMPTPAAYDKAEIAQIIAELDPKPSSYWIYQTAQGLVSHIVLRFDDTDGNKTYSPLTWGYLDGVSGWYRMGAQKPFPLYRLPELLNSKDRPVLIVEGEKTADAAQEIFSDYAVTTTSGGAQNAKNTEYSHLKNRDVYIWPDNDKVGFKYAEQIAAILKSIGVRSIHQVSIPKDFGPKWDLADVPPVGRGINSLTAMLTNAAPIAVADSRYELNTVCLADVEPEAIDFLWYPYVARGTLTMLDGDPGIGKSHITLAIACALSNGDPLPSQKSGQIGKTLLVAFEDNLPTAVKPRLIRMKADCSFIHSYPSQFTLDDDGMSKLRQMIAELKPDLVVIDPLFAYVGATTDINTANKVRSKLGPLSKIAEDMNCAMICVRHLKKCKVGQSLIYRGLGSIDVIASARSGLTIMNHPSIEHIRVMLHTKSNNGPSGQSIAFTFENDTFKWLGACDVKVQDYEDVQTSHEKAPRMGDASQFLKDILSHGPVAAKDVGNLAIKAGIAKGSLNRAKSMLNIESVKGRGSDNGWVWKLPANEKDGNLRNLENVEIEPTLSICGNHLEGVEDTEDTYDFDPHIYGKLESDDWGSQ